jgi:hypothetical protein
VPMLILALVVRDKSRPYNAFVYTDCQLRKG